MVINYNDKVLIKEITSMAKKLGIPYFVISKYCFNVSRVTLNKWGRIGFPQKYYDKVLLCHKTLKKIIDESVRYEGAVTPATKYYILWLKLEDSINKG